MRKIAFLTTVAALAVTSHPVFAKTQTSTNNANSAKIVDGQLDELVVTATRTGETRAQNTALPISVFSGDALTRSGAINVKDLVSLTPNLSVAQVSASAAIFVRGVGSNNVFAGSDPNVTVQSDGVYIARAFGQFADFADVERIEVLRGPQGTLYGRNAIGGTINILSRKPGDAFRGNLVLSAGNYNLRQAQGYVSGALVPGTVQFSVSGNYIRHDGHVDNIVPDSQDVGTANRGGVRAQLRIIPAANFEAITRVDYSEGSERLDYYDHILAPSPLAPLASSIIGNYRKTAIDTPLSNRTKLWGVAQEFNLQLSDAVALKSLTAYRRSSYNLLLDTDGTEAPVQTSRQAETSQQFSQEFNLVASFDRFKGVAGAYYFYDLDTTLAQAFIAPSIATPAANALTVRAQPKSRTRSIAFFAQGTYEILPTLSVTAGVRYTRDRKSIEQDFTRISLNPATPGLVLPGFPRIFSLSRTDSAVTPKFGLEYRATPTVLIYVSATRGYKSGGTNYAAASVAATQFGPETIWSYEGGIKADLLDRRLRANLSLFKYDYKDLQVQALIGPGLVSIGNAATADVKGAELELSARPVPQLQLGANLSLLRAEYGTFPQSAVPSRLIPYVTGDPRYAAATRTYNASGNMLNAAPRSSFSGSAQYDIALPDGSAFVRGEYFRQGKVYYDPTNAEIAAQRAYTLINGSIGYQDSKRKWRIALLGRNLTDTQYLITIAANGLVPAGIAGAPRTVMLQLTKEW